MEHVTRKEIKKMLLTKFNKSDALFDKFFFHHKEMIKDFILDAYKTTNTAHTAAK